MADLASTNERSVCTIEGLAIQARALRLSINMNLWQLARVFTEAKELVPHGEWEAWLRENADVSVRTAQDMMAAYKRFGDKPQFEGLGQAKTFKLLPLPIGIEEKFMEEHNVSEMSTREVQEAVKKVREEAQAEIALERRAREEAERRAEEAGNRQPVIPIELTDELRANRETIERQQCEVERLTAIGKEVLEEKNRLSKENSELQQEVSERDEMLKEQQEDLKSAQQQLLNAQSALAKGDAERAPAEQFTVDVFASAVRAFIGIAARMPHMRMAFSGMSHAEKEEYSVLLETVEKWAQDSRKALDSAYISGEVIFSE